MDIFSELKNAQAEQLATDPASHIKGRIYGTDTTAPLKIDDGTTFHKVLTDQMYTSIKTGIYPTGVTTLDLDPAISIGSSMVSYNFGSIGSSTLFFTTTSTTFVDVTTLSVATLVAGGGRPVEIGLYGGYIGTASLASPTTLGAEFRILRNGTEIAVFPLIKSFDASAYEPKISSISENGVGTNSTINHTAGVATAPTLYVPSASVRFIDTTAPSGSVTYKIQARAINASCNAAINGYMFVKEF